MPQTIKLKRSSTSGQAPTTAQLDFGELAINTSDGKVFLRKSDGQGDVIIEIGGSIVNNASTVTSSAVAPTNPTPTSGNLWYDTTNDVLMMYDGAGWQEVAHELSALQVNGNTRLGDNAAADTLTVNAVATFTGTDGMVIPSGTTAQRVTANTGTIRYNTDTSSFEGYSGSSWGSLGGVKDVDQDTYITTETSAGSDEDTFTFYAANNVNATWTSSLFDINTAVNIDGNISTTANSTFGNAAADTHTFNGSVDMNHSLNVDGNLVTKSNTTLGDASSDALTVNATADFNAPVNIDGNLTTTANSTFGNGSGDSHTFNGAVDMNHGLNVDGALTTTGTGTFGNAAGDTQTFNGAVDMNNNLNVDGSTSVNNFEIGSGNNFTFGQGANRVTFTDTTRMTVSNEAGTIIFDGRIFTP